MGKYAVIGFCDSVVHVDKYCICELISSPMEYFTLLTGDDSFLFLVKTISKIRVHSWRYNISIMCIISTRGIINQLYMLTTLLDLWN